MNISSKGKYPANKLSNFASHEFIVDNVKCSSMEGFLQSLKFSNIESQKITCLLSGAAAKKKGSGRNSYWKSKQTLWWNGVTYKRNSKEYQELIDRAYDQLFLNVKFQEALSSCDKKTVFTHSMGSNNKKETVLTESEFCKRLFKLKQKTL